MSKGDGGKYNTSWLVLPRRKGAKEGQQRLSFGRSSVVAVFGYYLNDQTDSKQSFRTAAEPHITYQRCQT